MNPIKRLLAKMMTNKMFAKISQDQNEALLDCLAYAVSMDGEVTDSELAEVRLATEMFNWRGALPLDEYFTQALERIEAQELDEASLRVWASELATRLGEDWLCDEAYYISARIATSDHTIDEQERVMLNALVESLGLSRARLLNITQKLMAETKF